MIRLIVSTMHNVCYEIIQRITERYQLQQRNYTHTHIYIYIYKRVSFVC